MPRDGKEVRRRLQLAALDLFRDRGYDVTTAAEIAARAGVTERTFFRHFPDKREALFDGDTLLSEGLVRAVRAATGDLGPWQTLFHAFRSVEQLFLDNRAFAQPRQMIIAASPALRERESAKVRSVIAALVSALVERGVPNHVATLAAEMGMVALRHAVAAWFADEPGDLDAHIVRAFNDVRELV